MFHVPAAGAMVRGIGGWDEHMENGDTLRKRADADSAIGTDPSMVVYGGAVGGCGSSYMADRQADRRAVRLLTGRGRLAAVVCRNLWAAAVFGIGQQHFLLLLF